MRLFIGIDCNELSDYFLSLQKELLHLSAKLSLTKTFHLTLKFLGEVSPNKVEAIKNCLKGISFTSINAATANISFFPGESYIRVLWVGIEPEEQIVGLSRSIDAALKELFRPEKSFKPHITLARVKYIEDKHKFLNKIKNIKTEAKQLNIGSFSLFKSTLSSKGALHEVLFSNKTPQMHLNPLFLSFSQKGQ